MKRSCCATVRPAYIDCQVSALCALLCVACSILFSGASYVICIYTLCHLYIQFMSSVCKVYVVCTYTSTSGHVNLCDQLQVCCQCPVVMHEQCSLLMQESDKVSFNIFCKCSDDKYSTLSLGSSVYNSRGSPNFGFCASDCCP